MLFLYYWFWMNRFLVRNVSGHCRPKHHYFRKSQYSFSNMPISFYWCFFIKTSLFEEILQYKYPLKHIFLVEVWKVRPLVLCILFFFLFDSAYIWFLFLFQTLFLVNKFTTKNKIRKKTATNEIIGQKII